MSVHLTKQTKLLVRVRMFNKQTNKNKLPVERFRNCSPNIWFVYSRTSTIQNSEISSLCIIY
ncbi:hypothetical protein Hanom_Chr08g00692631 [Helianthus anomalus]